MLACKLQNSLWVSTRLCHAFRLGFSSVSFSSVSRPVKGMGSHVSENDPEVIEKEKERSISKKVKSRVGESAPGWSELLASDSESVVKAERTTVTSVEEMQRMTIECLKEEDECAEQTEIASKIKEGTGSGL